MPFDRYLTFQPDESTYNSNALRNNANGVYLDKEALERFKIRELCEGWGSYRDAAESVPPTPKNRCRHALTRS